VGVTLALVLGGGGGHPRLARVTTCNGYAALCDRRLNEVVFAGTHNSMSAADTPGWYIPNQNHDVARQLADGIRFFKVSPHYGLRARGGSVGTDFAAEDRKRNRVAKKLSPQAVASLQRLGGRLGLGNPRAQHDVWLCHTVCELGATRMLDVLTTIHDFIDRNPGTVLFIDDESFAKESDVADVFKRADLLRHVVALNHLEPLPTLRELADAGHNVIVLNEQPVSGQYEWNQPMFTWVQDTPLGAKRPSEFTCNRSRGTPDSPLFMINNWADGFPPLLSANQAILKRSFILGRARQCTRERGQRPSIIASDFYDKGDLVQVVRELNGLRNVTPAKAK
jgi:hypothetical protein